MLSGKDVWGSLVQLPWKAVAKTRSGLCLAQSHQESGATVCYGCAPVFAPKPAVVMCDLWPGTWLILRLTSELLPSSVPTAGMSS